MKIWLILAIAAFTACRGQADLSTPESASLSGDNPLNTAFTIDGQQIHLRAGQARTQAAPGSAIHAETSVWEKPIYGDLDGDGDDDAALVLAHDPGGSGTFYYIAAAIYESGQFAGTSAQLLGDRVLPLNLAIQHRVLSIEFADRADVAPMSFTPNLARAAWTRLSDGELLPLTAMRPQTTVMAGSLTMGHETREFRPCDSRMPTYWLTANKVLPVLTVKTRQILGPDAPPYTPVFAILAGKVQPAPKEGFGADYRSALMIDQVLYLAPDGECL